MQSTTGALEPQRRRPFYKHLYFWVLFAILAGVLFGIMSPSDPSKVPEVLRPLMVLGTGWAEAMKPFGDAFIRIISMLIAPIIFCTVVHGIASMKDMGKVGRVGVKALVYFEIMTTVALAIGLVVANIIKPGVGATATASASAAADASKYLKQGESLSVVDYMLHLIPKTFVGAFADGEILQVLILAILFGFALMQLGERGKPVAALIDQVTTVFFNIVGIVMKVAPIGAFGAMAFTIGKYGLATLIQLGSLMATFYLTCLIFIFIGLGFVGAIFGFNIFKFLSYIKEELLIVLGTSSSESALPRLMRKMERLGCEETVVGLVVPAGYSFNLDGTCIYLTLAALFLAQATHTDLTLAQQLGILGILLLTSKGAAGVTGSGFIVLASTLSATHTIPPESIALILGVDRFMSEGRALTNLIGNGVATIVVSAWEGALNRDQMRAQLSGRTVDDFEPITAAAE